MPKRKLSKEDVETIQRLVLHGANKADVARVFSVSLGTVHYHTHFINKEEIQANRLANLMEAQA